VTHGPRESYEVTGKGVFLFAALLRPGWRGERRKQNDSARGRSQLLCRGQAKPVCPAAGDWSWSLCPPQGRWQVVHAFPCLLRSSFSQPLPDSRVCKREQHNPAPSNKMTCSASAFRILLLFAALCCTGTAHSIPKGCKPLPGHFYGETLPLRISSAIGLQRKYRTPL